MAGKAGRGSDQFMIRLPDGMRDRIKAAADANGRSMNAEIVATLEDQYPARSIADDYSTLSAQAVQLVETLPNGMEKDTARIAVREHRYDEAIEIVERIRRTVGDERKNDIESLQLTLSRARQNPGLNWLFK